MAYAFASDARQITMQPPAAGPLIHGSTTPMAKEVAMAASIASPPASSTAAPASAARRCCAATTPPRVATTDLRTIWAFEKLSFTEKLLAAIGFGVPHDVGMRREPHVLIFTFKRAHVVDQLLQDPDARAIAADVRMHRELEQPALAVRGVELAPEDVEHVRGRRIGAQRGEAVHVEVHRVVADPLDRQLDDAGVLAVHRQLVAVDIGHQRRVVEEAHLLRDRQRALAAVPRRRADADRAHAGDFLQHVGRAHLQVALGFEWQLGIALVDPAVDADLVALGGDATLLVRIKERGHRRNEEARFHVESLEQLEDARDSLAVSVLALRQT